MYRYLILIFISLFSFSFGQNNFSKYAKQTQESKIYGKIYGVIKDLNTNQPLSYASISLFMNKMNTGQLLQIQDWVETLMVSLVVCLVVH